MIFGPITQAIVSAGQVNTSNQFILDLVNGKHSEQLPATGLCYWADARDVALAIKNALETPAAEGKRFIIATGTYSNKDICDVIRDNFPAYTSVLPPRKSNGGNLPPGGVARIDNSRGIDILKMEYRPLHSSITDLVRSLETAKLVPSEMAGRRKGQAKI